MSELFDSLLHSAELGYMLFRMVVIVLLTHLVAKLISKLTRNRFSQKLHFKFLNNIINVLVYVVGFAIALDQIPNFNKAFEAIMAGSGIAALTIGLAAQESLGNFINGMVISASKPFEVGDRVRLINGNITGYIEDITMRHTVVRTFMNSRIIVPNSVINKDMIENSNFLDGKASAFIDVIITHDSDMELAREIMARVVENHPDFVDTRSPEDMHLAKVKVYVRSLSVYGVELRTSMWTKNIGNNFEACSEVRRLIKHEFDGAGIRFVTGVVAPPPA